MAASTVTNASAAPTSSIVPAWEAATAAGDLITNQAGKTILLVRNNHASDPRTVTIAPVSATAPARGPYPAVTVPTISVEVAAETTRVLGPFRAAYQNSSGQINPTYSDSGADIEVAAIDLP